MARPLLLPLDRTLPYLTGPEPTWSRPPTLSQVWHVDYAGVLINFLWNGPVMAFIAARPLHLE